MARTTRSHITRFKEAMARKREKLQTERNGHSDKLTPKERALAERGTVRFGDVALAPPVISVKPKERHTRVKLPSKPRQNDVEEDVCEDEFDSDAVDGSSDKKTKKKRTLSLHQKQQMEIERRNAVRLYRLQKEMMKGEK